MKKKYMNPTLDVVEIKYTQQLLTASSLGLDPTAEVNDVEELLSRDASLDEEDEDFDFDEEGF